MADRNMFAIQSLLNRSPPTRPRTPCTPSPTPPRPQQRPRAETRQSGSERSSPASEMTEVSTPITEARPRRRGKKIQNASDLSYTRPQGKVRYPPYEDLEPSALQLIRHFNITQFGQIAQWSAHIPYSSDKKDVFEKTGRESFHIFVYTFTDPSNQQTYDVMWDWEGGFVRISPFFKSTEHKKTGPAKMLELNKGLREVTIQMTGGNRAAQGYWMPFHCARAACATFCHPIAGALIPIFGPSFPDECIRPDSPRFRRMVIDEQLIRQAKHEVTVLKHTNLLSQRSRRGPVTVTSHPRSGGRSFEPERPGSAPYTPCFDPYFGSPSCGMPVGNCYSTSKAGQFSTWESPLGRDGRKDGRGAREVREMRKHVRPSSSTSSPGPGWTAINAGVDQRHVPRHDAPYQSAVSQHKLSFLDSDLTLAPMKRRNPSEEEQRPQRDHKRPRHLTKMLEQCQTTTSIGSLGTLDNSQDHHHHHPAPGSMTRARDQPPMIQRERRITPALENLVGDWDRRKDNETRMGTGRGIEKDKDKAVEMAIPKESSKNKGKANCSAEVMQAASILTNIQDASSPSEVLYRRQGDRSTTLRSRSI